MNDQKRWNRKHKQLSNTGQNKEANNCISGDIEMPHTLKDSGSYSKMSANDTVANTCDFLTLYELSVLEQKKSKLSLQKNKNNNISPKADVISCEPSHPNQLTLYELYERQGFTWKKNRDLAPAQEKHFTPSDNKESASGCNNFLTVYEICKMKGLECDDQRKNIPKREFIPNPVYKDFFIQLRNKRMEKIPEWIKAIWRKQANQQSSEGLEIASSSERETVDDNDDDDDAHAQTDPGYHGLQQKNLGYDSSHSSGNYSEVYFQENANKAENANSDSNAINNSEALEDSDDVPLLQLYHKEQFSEKPLLQRKKYKVENENNERLGVHTTETAASVVEDKHFYENRKHSACLSASKIESQKTLQKAKIVLRKLESSQLENSSFRTAEERFSAGHDTQQQQPKLINGRDRIREESFSQKDQASSQLSYTVTLRRIPDIPSSFDETDASFLST